MVEGKEKQLVRLAWRVLFAILAVCLGAEFLMHPHVAFGVEGTLFFHAWYGFFACVIVVLFSKLLGFVIKRANHYYSQGDDTC